MSLVQQNSEENFLDHEGLKKIRKLRSQGKIDEADKILCSAIPSPAVANEIRKNASLRAREAKNRGDWKAVVTYLEGYNRYAKENRQACIRFVNQEPPEHTKSDQELLKLAKVKQRDLLTEAAICPYCQKLLEKPPNRKKKCPHCGEYMYVRRGNAYTEKQVKEYDFLQGWLYRLEDHYGISEADFEDHRSALSKQFGFRANSHDTVWRVLNAQITMIPTYPTDEHRAIYLDMAHMVRQEGKDPKMHIESANKVQSDLIKEAIVYRLNTSSNLSPDTQWTVSTANDDYVCPSCREAEQAPLSANEAIKVPLNCTGEHGCRCWIKPVGGYVDEEVFREKQRARLGLDEKTTEKKLWWKFWK